MWKAPSRFHKLKTQKLILVGGRKQRGVGKNGNILSKEGGGLVNIKEFVSGLKLLLTRFHERKTVKIDEKISPVWGRTRIRGGKGKGRGRRSTGLPKLYGDGRGRQTTGAPSEDKEETRGITHINRGLGQFAKHVGTDKTGALLPKTSRDGRTSSLKE